MFNFEEELKKLPHSPGVYLMRDSHDDIIYVGKAISLRNRVRSYFRESTNKSPKIEKMVTKIARFEYIVTDSELEALILECNLIKEYRPRYNTMLRDDKTYPYICVTTSEEYPRLQMVRKMKKDKNKYFGPDPYLQTGTAPGYRERTPLLKSSYQTVLCALQRSDLSGGLRAGGETGAGIFKRKFYADLNHAGGKDAGCFRTNGI